jgi:6,7-dimethyl-8-ribityllumazine synthase
VDRLIDGAIAGLRKAGAQTDNVTIIRVPGAFEIPLGVQRAAASKNYDGIIALGCVIRGDTPHFEYVCQQAATGIGRVGLDYGIPVAFGILTVNTEEQATVRSQSNETNKGFEAAMAVVEMINLLKKL